MAIWVYGALLGLAAGLGHRKAKLWVRGRKAWPSRLQAAIQQQPGEWIWLHAASLGEFEQGAPLLEQIRQQYPNKRILLSFFSPSGYEARKNDPIADYVCYLPLDSPQNARAWLDLLNPSLIFFVKYEFWYNFLKEIRLRKIPCYLVSGIFRPKQAFFKSWGGLFREMLQGFDWFFVQNKSSAALLKSIGFENTLVTGDTRLDRVLEIKAQAKKFPPIDTFVGTAPVFVVGSSWAADETHYLPFLSQYLIPKGWKIIIAPHEVDQQHIQQLEKRLKSFHYQLYSQLSSNHSLGSTDILIIDNIGMLSSLYAYAQVAYVGGGFGKGIHNILEAAVYQIPVLFGPQHKKFAEAQELLKLGVAFEVGKSHSFQSIFQKLNYEHIAQQAATYLNGNSAASIKIIATIKHQLGEKE